MTQVDPRSDEPYAAPQTKPGQTARQGKYRTAPVPTQGMPPGVPYIIANEAAERFSFYGMKSILLVFMTEHLLNRAGELDVMSTLEAQENVHYFVAAVYLFPLFGALLADTLLGKYRTIIWLSIVYCLGHLALAVDDTRLGLLIGLGLIAVGSGGIKPCVSANVGDQFGAANKHLIPRVFMWFYFSINFGSALSTLLTMWLLTKFGPHVAFATPGVLMLLATIFFWAGRHKYVHVPPGGAGFVRQLFDREVLTALGKLAIVYAFIAFFWALFDQHASSWIAQGKRMNCELPGLASYPAFLQEFFRPENLPSQIQAANPIMIMLMIPLFSYLIYPQVDKVFKLTALRRITIGLFLTAGSFAYVAMVERWIEAGDNPSVLWQLIAYLILTAGEVMVSITALEFSYTQAPAKIKSLVMSLYLLSVFAGNIFTAQVSRWMMDADGNPRFSWPTFFWIFAGIMAVVATGFIFVALFYKERTYLQEETPGDA